MAPLTDALAALAKTFTPPDRLDGVVAEATGLLKQAGVTSMEMLAVVSIEDLNIIKELLLSPSRALPLPTDLGGSAPLPDTSTHTRIPPYTLI